MSHLSGKVVSMGVLGAFLVCMPAAKAYDASVISTIEATVYDQNGASVATGGPWSWSSGLWILSNLPMGSGNTLTLVARDAYGSAIYGGSLADIEIIPDFLTGAGSFIMMATTEGIYVLAPPFTEVGVVILLPLKVDVAIDVLPGSNDNPFNTRAKGLLPVALAGAPDLDVADINTATIAILGVAPVKVSVEDVLTWSNPDGEGPVASGGPDGLPDLVLHFDRQALATAIGPVSGGDVVPLVLDGALTAGTPIEGLDHVTIKPTAGKK